MKTTYGFFTKFILVIFMMSLSSCFIERNIMKRGQPVTISVLKGLHADKKYKFYFDDGNVYKVRIEGTNSTSIYGRVITAHKLATLYRNQWGEEIITATKLKEEYQKSISFDYKQILGHTKKVTYSEFSPIGTVFMAGVTSALILLVAIYLSYEYGW